MSLLQVHLSRRAMAITLPQAAGHGPRPGEHPEMRVRVPHLQFVSFSFLRNGIWPFEKAPPPPKVGGFQPMDGWSNSPIQKWKEVSDRPSLTLPARRVFTFTTEIGIADCLSY